VRLQRIASLLVVVVLLVSCAARPASLSTRETVGRWVTKGPHGEQGTIDFDGDRTFVGNELPGNDFFSGNTAESDGPADWGSQDRIAGTWDLWKDSASNEFYVKVDITGRLGGTKFIVGSAGDELTLEYPVGHIDDGNYVTFRHAAG